MTEPKTCSTCHWWFQYSGNHTNWGKCVWHTGVKKTLREQMRFKGGLETNREFGCIKHEEDRKA